MSNGEVYHTDNIRGDGIRGDGVFFAFFCENGLTKVHFGCILYDIGSEKGRCSLQKRDDGDEIGETVRRGSEEFF